MHQRLEDGDAVFRAVAHPPQGCERETMRCAIGQVKTAVGIEVLVLCVSQTIARGRHHAEIFVARGRLGLERPILTRLSSSGLLMREDRDPSR